MNFGRSWVQLEISPGGEPFQLVPVRNNYSREEFAVIADHHNGLNQRAAAQYLLNVAGRNLLAGGKHQGVFGASHNAKPAARIQRAQVAGSQPSLAKAFFGG